MVTLQSLATELNVAKMDEIVGGLYHQGDVNLPHMEEMFAWTITTKNGTSGSLGNTWTTQESIKFGGPCECEPNPEEPYEIGYLM